MSETLQDYRDAYYERSGKASDIARQISFAGIALIWIFRDEKSGPVAIPHFLLCPAILLISALAFDLLQAVFAAAIWGGFARYHEKKGKKPTDRVVAPRYFNWPALSLFWSKLLLVLIAYYQIFQFIAQSIKY